MQCVRAFALLTTVAFAPDGGYATGDGLEGQWSLTGDTLTLTASVTPASGSASGLTGGTVTFFDPPPAKFGMGSMATWPGADGYAVPARSLDALLDELGAGPVKVLKVDVEGFELDVFRGAVRSLARVTAPSCCSSSSIGPSGGPGTSTTVPSVLVYQNAFANGRVGLAAAVAVVLTVLIFALAFAITKLVDRDPTR